MRIKANRPKYRHNHRCRSVWIHLQGDLLGKTLLCELAHFCRIPKKFLVSPVSALARSPLPEPRELLDWRGSRRCLPSWWSRCAVCASSGRPLSSPALHRKSELKCTGQGQKGYEVFNNRTPLSYLHFINLNPIEIQFRLGPLSLQTWKKNPYVNICTPDHSNRYKRFKGCEVFWHLQWKM